MNDNTSQTLAVPEYIAAYCLNTVGNSNVYQIGTSVECTGIDNSQRVGKGDILQGSATGKYIGIH